MGDRDFPELLREHRGRAGLSQEELAAKARVAVQTIGKLERGEHRNRPHAETLERLASALGLQDELRREFTAAGRLQRERQDAEPAMAGSALDQAAEILAGQVLQQWREEAVIRRLLDPLPLDVRWSAAPAGLGDSEQVIRDVARQVGGRGRRLRLQGSAATVVEAFRSLLPPRLVVLGPPGSGKSALLVLLSIGLLQDRGNDPVPVVLNLSTWDAGRERFETWVTRRLRADYPRLQTLRPEVVADLVSVGRVLPLLDGLDELPPELRSRAVDALKRLGPGQPLVVACRTREYEELVAGGSHVRAAPVIELQALEPAAVADYLRAGAPGWGPVLERLSGDGSEPLAGALMTPLMASLALAVYGTRAADPGELLDGERFPSQPAIEDHLLDELIPAVFEADPPPEPAQRRWRREDARRWLVFLARRLQQRGTSDLAWWDLSPWRPSATPLLCLAGVILFGLAGRALGNAYALLMMTIGGAGFGFLIGFTDERWPARTALRLDRQLAVGLLRGLWTGLRVALLIALALEAVFGPVVFLLLRSWTWVLAVLTVAIGLAVPACVAFWLGSALVGALVRTTGDLVSPRVALRSDRTAFVLTLATAGLGLGLVVALLGLAPAFVEWVLAVLHLRTRSTADVGSPLASLLLPVGLVGLATIVAVFPWPKYQIARAWFTLTGRLPWDVMAFLADAHHLGVLRQAGPVYQFRHARLQERLAGDVRPVDRLWSPLRARVGSRRVIDWLRGVRGSG